MEFSFDYLGNKKTIDVSKVPWYKEGFGLMFVSSRKAECLLFDLKRDVRMRIHSYFVRFPFIAIWLDEEKKVVEIKQIKPSRGLIRPKRPFRYLVEIPMTGKYDAIVKTLVGKETFKY